MPESLDLSLQRLDSRCQLRQPALLCSDLLVLLRNQGQQGVLTQICEVFGAIHGTEYSPPTWPPQAKPLINYLGFKSFVAAHDTLVGIELMHMLKKQQRMAAEGAEGLTAAAQFYALAA
jgi:hypothetical protein